MTLGRSRKLSSNSKITVRLAHDYFSTFSEDLIFWDCLTEEDGKEAAAYFADKGVEAIFTNGDPVAGAGRMACDWTGQFIHQRAAAAFNDRSSLASLRGDCRPIGDNGKKRQLSHAL